MFKYVSYLFSTFIIASFLAQDVSEPYLIVLGTVFSPATKKVNQIGEGLKNVPYKGAPEVVDELKTYITKGDSFLFEQSLGWMLRYYLYGEKYRRQHYAYKEKNLENMKPRKKKHEKVRVQQMMQLIMN